MKRSRNVVAITVTECVQRRDTAVQYWFDKRNAAIPVSRIAKIQDAGLNTELITQGAVPKAYIILRTPEDAMFVEESPALVAALMNQDPDATYALPSSPNKVRT